ncbi:hypothetical protein [Pyxidicoccus xibeiensis]|uniref:hypothetical protein n=1 Tax=Pyxidicoccus xibeiensis TaxID=2906759 RepID=UPI0020A81502|nr:hypothetical protein [Pyxidicoccus xibeiensis]MCP3144548.1 hypothetical protein [Pyxidicoccus xibeiensis]
MRYAAAKLNFNPIGTESMSESTAKEDLPRIREIEALIDAGFKKNPLLRNPTSSCIWYLLTVHEDYVRLENLAGEKTEEELFIIADRAKYALKYALEWVMQSTSEGAIFSPPHHIHWGRYKHAKQLFERALNYELVVAAFVNFSRGAATARLVDRNTTKFSRPVQETAYDVLDIFLGRHRNGSGTQSLFKDSDLNSGVQGVLANVLASVRPKGPHGIQYRYDVETLRQAALLYGRLTSALRVLPASWSFRGITPEAFNETWTILTARCAIHMLAHTQAAYLGYDAAAAGTAALLTSREDIVNEISAVAKSATSSIVAEIIALLTYDAQLPRGKRDPALQPLIPLSGNRIGIAPHLIVSSNGERNLVALLARHYKDEYDRTTDVLEIAQLEQLRRELSGAPFRVATDKRVPRRNDLPNIDMVLADESGGVMLLIEVKWVIETSEASEVFERASTQRKAASQLSKLMEFAHDKPAQLWAVCFPDVLPPSDLRVSSCIVMRGFAGVAPVDPAEPPVVPELVLIEAARHAVPLGRLVSWIEGRKFLPIEGVNFRQHDDTVTFDELSVIWGGFDLLSPPQFCP